MKPLPPSKNVPALIISREGRVEEIDRCVGCNQGCLDGFADLNMPHITCLRNPAIGRETECAAAMQPTQSPKTILIAGGGIAGLEAARTLKLKGHDPILCEAGDALGGQFVLAGKAPRKEEMEAAIQSMASQVQRMGVDVRLNTPVTPELLEEIKPAALFNCIGATPLIPKISGAEGAHVANSHDVLAGKVKPTGRVVINGGGMVGMEVAELLAEQGCTVTDLEMMKEFCADLGSARKICVTESIYAHGITPVTEVKVTEIREGAVLGEKDGKTVEYPCDWAVLAIGSRKRDGAALEAACRKLGIGYLALGDAAGARRAMNATREAFDAALRVDDETFMQDIIAGPKTVFVTGATGTMGQETVKQLLARSPRFKVRVLARPSDKNRALLKKMAHPMLEVVWGDGSERQGCVQLCPCRRQVDGKAAQRCHPERLLRGVHYRAGYRRSLPHLQVCRQRLYPDPCPGAWSSGHPGQRRCPRHYRDRHDEGCAQGDHRASRCTDPPAPSGSAGGHRQCTGVPCLGEGILHHRRCAERGRFGKGLTIITF